MSMYATSDREGGGGGYPKGRENGYARSPYEERDYMSTRYAGRTLIDSRERAPMDVTSRRDYMRPREERDPRDFPRDMGYRPKRDWAAVDVPSFPPGPSSGFAERRDYRSHMREELNHSPSKRRKIEGLEPKEYVRHPYSFHPERSRSPSPSGTHYGSAYGGNGRVEEKERFHEYYESRDPYKNIPYSRGEAEYSRGYFGHSSRSTPRGWDRKYEYSRPHHDNGYRFPHEEYRRVPYDKYGARPEYERGERYSTDYKDYERERPRSREGGQSREQEHHSYYKERQDRMDNRYYNPYSPLRDDIQKEHNESEQDKLYSHSERREFDVPGASPLAEESPTPKKRLGWGQGLVAFEQKRKGDGEEKESPKTPQTPQPEEIQREVSMDISPQGKEDYQFVKDIPQGLLPQSESTQFSLDQTKYSPDVNSHRSFPPTAAKYSSPRQPANVIPEPPKPKDPRSRPDLPNEVSSSPQSLDGDESPMLNYIFPSFPLKDEVVAEFDSMEKEIAETERRIAKLKNPKKHEHKHQKLFQSLTEMIYEENGEKATTAEEELSSLAHPSVKPGQKMYNGPADLPIYHENIKRHASIKQEIHAAMWKQRKQVKRKEEKLVSKYQKIFDKWKAKVKKMEMKRKKKEQKQKRKKNDDNVAGAQQFIRRPLLRSSMSRPGQNTPLGRGGVRVDHIRSEVEMEEVLARLKEQDDSDPNSKYIKTIALVPTMILKEKRIPVFVDRNGLVEDPMLLEKERKLVNPWTEKEKRVFLKKFQSYGKNFSRISTYLENKSTEEVVWYYYMNKKTLNLKGLLNDAFGPKRRGPRKNAPSAASLSPVVTQVSTSRELGNLGVQWANESRNKPRGSRANINYNEDLTFTDRTSGDSKSAEQQYDTKWTDTERDTFLHFFSKFGKEWKTIANQVRTKNQFQCKNFYHNMKKKLGLDQILEANNPVEKKTKSDSSFTPKESKRSVTIWSEEQKSCFLKFLKEYGKNWKKLATLIPGKSVYQIKTYFQNHKFSLNLEQLLDEFESKQPGKKRGRAKGPGDKRNPKRRNKKVEDSDSSAVPSPVISISSPLPSETSMEPPSTENSFPVPDPSLLDGVSSLLDFANTVTVLAERERLTNPPVVVTETAPVVEPAPKVEEEPNPTEVEMQELDIEEDSEDEEEMTESAWDEKDDEEDSYEKVEDLSSPGQDEKVSKKDVSDHEQLDSLVTQEPQPDSVVVVETTTVEPPLDTIEASKDSPATGEIEEIVDVASTTVEEDSALDTKLEEPTKDQVQEVTEEVPPSSEQSFGLPQESLEETQAQAEEEVVQPIEVQSEKDQIESESQLCSQQLEEQLQPLQEPSTLLDSPLDRQRECQPEEGEIELEESPQGSPDEGHPVRMEIELQRTPPETLNGGRTSQSNPGLDKLHTLADGPAQDEEMEVEVDEFTVSSPPSEQLLPLDDTSQHCTLQAQQTNQNAKDSIQQQSEEVKL